MNLGQEQDVKIGSRVWIIGRLTSDVIFGFRDWIREQIGDPFALLEKLLPHLDKSEAMERIKLVESVDRQLKNFSMQSPLAKEFMGTETGAAKLFHLLLKERQPEASMNDAMDVLIELGRQGKVQETLAKAQGSSPGAAGNPPAPAA